MITLGKRHFITLLALLLVLAGIAFVQAWTGPTAAPPSGNITAPVNVGSVDQIKTGGISVDALAVFGNAVLTDEFDTSDLLTYLNFSSTPGAAGYGFRSNAGVMEFKNSTGAWSSFLPTTNVQSISFSDGTIQTTAASSSGSGSGTGGNSGDQQTFTSSGTWTKPAGTGDNQLVVVEMWGGGGGGSTSGGGGGGGGAYNRLVLKAGNLSSTVAVTVGSGGTVGNPGTVGGTSSFGSHGSAYGGAGAGGGGGGITSAGASGQSAFGGEPNGGKTQYTGTDYYAGGYNSTYGGGVGGIAMRAGAPAAPIGAGGNSVYGGGGGIGGKSVYGGGGGAGSGGVGGTSVYGGAGGNPGTPGSIPGGGGGWGAGGTGARGEVRVWTVPASGSGSGGGITAVTTVSCSSNVQNGCTVSCPATYFRTGCDEGTLNTSMAVPSGTNACTQAGVGGPNNNPVIVYAYCAK